MQVPSRPPPLPRRPAEACERTGNLQSLPIRCAHDLIAIRIISPLKYPKLPFRRTPSPLLLRVSPPELHLNRRSGRPLRHKNRALPENIFTLVPLGSPFLGLQSRRTPSLLSYGTGFSASGILVPMTPPAEYHRQGGQGEKIGRQPCSSSSPGAHEYHHTYRSMYQKPYIL